MPVMVPATSAWNLTPSSTAPGSPPSTMTGTGLVGQIVYPPAGSSHAPLVWLHVWPTGHADVLTHTPLVQTSAVQATPSLHGAVLFRKTQPVAASQLSSVQGLPSLHTSGVPAVQVPDWQVSTPLQALPSLQLVPLDRKSKRLNYSHLGISYA